jgi:hypothetical protein
MPGSLAGRRGGRTLGLLIVTLVAVAAIAAAVGRRASEEPAGPRDGHAHVTAQAVPRRETRPTLDPAGFTGEVAVAYQIAREIPGVLDQLHCHCNCHSQYGHASLLSCYVDGHAST